MSGNGLNVTLGSSFFDYLNPPTAFTLTTPKPVIVLGPEYFSEPPGNRVATLIHEEFHAVTGWTDADVFAVFSKYGLPDTQFKLWPHPTNEFTQWILRGCPK